MKKYWILIGVGVIGVALDQFTKTWIMDAYRLGETLPVLKGFFNLTYVRNTGSAFSFMANADPSFRVPFFLLLPSAALVGIGYVFSKTPVSDRWLIWGLSFTVSGAIGNLIDRVRFGSVTDFLHFHWMGRYHFPMFNVADIAIFVGVSMLMLDLWKKDRHESRSKRATHPSGG
jgi:signal peptidase II